MKCEKNLKMGRKILPRRPLFLFFAKIKTVLKSKSLSFRFQGVRVSMVRAEIEEF